MTPEELIQENEKLKDRLSNAVKVFKQQKADIERLTAERDEAKAALEKSESRAKELEAQKIYFFDIVENLKIINFHNFTIFLI